MAFNQPVILTNDSQVHGNYYNIVNLTSDANNLTAEQFVNSVMYMTTGNVSDTTPSATDIIDFLGKGSRVPAGTSFETYIWSYPNSSININPGEGVNIRGIYDYNYMNHWNTSVLARYIGVVGQSDDVTIYMVKM